MCRIDLLDAKMKIQVYNLIYELNFISGQIDELHVKSSYLVNMAINDLKWTFGVKWEIMYQIENFEL